MEIKYDNLIFTFLLAVIVIGISFAIAQSAPNPGHPANEIWYGEFFGGGDYIFPSGSNVGIGASPSSSYVLDVAGKLNLRTTAADQVLYVDDVEALWYDGNYFSWGFGGDYNYFADKVGIGTTNPGRPLSIQGTGSNNEIMEFKDSSGSTIWHINFYSSGLNFVETGVADYRLFIDQGGNVGIGTPSPSEKLDVAGNIKATGSICGSAGCVGSGGDGNGGGATKGKPFYFLTSVAYDGNLGGFSGANAKCSEEVPGSYLVILDDDAISGTYILSAPIVTLDADPSTNKGRVYSHNNWDCSDWTSASGATSTLAVLTNLDRLTVSAPHPACDYSYRLWCYKS